MSDPTSCPSFPCLCDECKGKAFAVGDLIEPVIDRRPRETVVRVCDDGHPIVTRLVTGEMRVYPTGHGMRVVDRLSADDSLGLLNSLIAAGWPLRVPDQLREAVAQAVKSKRPADIDQWAETLAEDLAAADDDG